MFAKTTAFYSLLDKAKQNSVSSSFQRIVPAHIEVGLAIQTFLTLLDSWMHLSVFPVTLGLILVIESLEQIHF